MNKELQSQTTIPQKNLNQNFSKHLEDIFGTLKDPVIPPVAN